MSIHYGSFYLERFIVLTIMIIFLIYYNFIDIELYSLILTLDHYRSLIIAFTWSLRSSANRNLSDLTVYRAYL